MTGFQRFKNINSIYIILSAVAMSVVFILLFISHLKLITYSYPLESRESAPQVVEKYFLSGENPYELKNLPKATYVYGFLYPMIVYPLASILGNELQTFRIITAFFIFASLFILFLFLNENVKDKIPLLSGLILLYAMLLFDVIPSARPESLGLFLFLSGIYIPWKMKYSIPSLIASVVIGLLAFYTKPYFILFIPVLCAYLFLFESKLKGFAFFIGSVILFIIFALIVKSIFTVYFNVVLYGLLNVIESDFSYSLQQLFFFITNFWGYILTAALIFGSVLLRKKSAISEPLRINSHEMDKPLINKKMSMEVFFFLVFFCFLVFKMGTHPGSWMIYHIEFLSPFILLYLFNRYQFDHIKIPKIILNSVVVVVMVCNAFILNVQYRGMQEELDNSFLNWLNFDNNLTQYKNIYASRYATSILINQDKDFFDSGMSEYFEKSKSSNNPLSLVLGPLFIHDEEITKRLDENKRNITLNISNKNYDCICADAEIFYENHGIISNNYNFAGSIPIFTPRSKSKYFPVGAFIRKP